MKKISIRNFLLGGAILSVLLGCISEFTPQVSATTSLDLTVSGALSDYLKSRQILVGTSFDATYQKIYTIFQNTGMTILRAVDYQSLVCLGVLPSQSLLTQLQIDKMDIKTSFNKDFIQLENQITSLQEKYRLQQDTNIDVLNGVTYAEAQDQIKSDIDKIVSIHTGLIQAFEVGYKTKILKFITDYSQYLTQNKALVQTISAKVVKLQYIVNESNKMDAGINQIYKNLQIADIMNKVSLLQSSLQKVFLENINPYIDTQVKKFKVATLLSGALADLKMTTLQQYNQEKDAYFAKTFAPWYNYAQYTKTQQAIQGIKGDYYTANKLNCNKLLVSNSNVTEEKLFSDIANTLQNISSGIILSK